MSWMKACAAMLCVLPGVALARPGREHLASSLLSARHREPCQIEIPADVDLNRQDRIILLNDSRVGGVEATYLQLLNASGAFIAGPHLPRGTICDLQALELDRGVRSAGSSSAEIVIGLRHPLGLEVISSAMGLVAFCPLPIDPPWALASPRIEGVLDVDGVPPDELLVSLTPDGSGSTALLCVEWMTGSVRWWQPLPGRVSGPVFMWSRGDSVLAVVACVDSAGATLVVLASDGNEVRRACLATAPTIAAYPQILDDHLDQPRLAVLVTPADTAGSPPTLSILNDLGSSMHATVPLRGALGPIMACQVGGETRIVCGSEEGDLLVCDLEPRLLFRYRVVSGPVTLTAVDDLDLNGEPEAVMKTYDGHTACVSLTDGQVMTVAGNDEVRLLHTGFGAPPWLVTREGGQYRSWQILRVASLGGGVRVRPWLAIALAAALAMAMLALVDVTSHHVARRRMCRGLSDTKTAVALSTARGRLRWVNQAMRDLLGGDPLRRGVGMDELFFGAGFAKRARSAEAGPTREARLFRDGLYYRVHSTAGPRPYLGCGVRLVCVEEDTSGSMSRGGDSWSPVAREITVLMRDALSTIRLSVQRLQVRQDSPGRLSSPDTSLRRVAGEVSRL
ncbi:hypothetical protein JXA88_02460, partial [Candidatus Fermentibacteria bacterium]|nr:hypothetical protein [Candidatus Fermentibacteria bacterium]